MCDLVVFASAGAIAGVVVIKRLHPHAIRIQQISQHLLHWHAAIGEARRVIVGIGRNRLIDELLHDRHFGQVAKVISDVPQVLVSVANARKFRHDIFTTPSLDDFTDTGPRGGSMPLVELVIWLEVSQGI